MAIAMIAPSGRTGIVQTRTGNTYTIDAYGLLAAVQADVADLLLAGFTFAPSAGATMRNTYTATSDPGVGNDVTQDFGPGSLWINTTGSRVWMCLSNAAGAAQWLLDGVVPGVGAEPSNMITQFGSSSASFLEEGNIYRTVGNPIAGNTAVTSDVVLAVYAMPALAFDLAGRGICVTAQGITGSTTNNKRVKAIWAPTSATVGSAVVGGIAIADTGAWVNATTPNNAAGWQLMTNVFKYGAPNSNTQYAQGTAILGATHGGITPPVFTTASESGAILIALTGSSYTTGAANDVIANFFEVNAMN